MKKRLRSFWRILMSPFRLIFWVVRLIFGWLKGLGVESLALFREEPEDTTMADALAKAVNNPIGVLEHLNDLRKHLTRAVIILLIMTVVSFAYASEILAFLAEPVGGIDELRAIGVTEPIGVFMRVSLLTGFALSLPYIVLEILLFAAPGLRMRERRMGITAIPAVTILFLGGMAFAYFVLLEPALDVLIGFMGIPTTPQPSSYYPFVTSLMFWLGLSFEFPLIIYVIVAMGLIRANVLVEQARFAIVIMAVLAAAITPTVDPINMLLVWGPLVALYYFGVGLAFIAQRGRDRRIKAQNA